MARPLKEPRVEESVIEDMAAIGCTNDEMAVLSGLSVDTLHRRYAELIAKGRARRKQSLRHKQTELALSGDKTMLIWLGKQDLGQSDKSEVRSEATVSAKVVNVADAVEQYAQAVEEVLAAAEAATGQGS